jgi:hypothetical protein
MNLSAVAGLTYNFVNPSTEDQSGIDVHLDWGASRLLTKRLQIGLVGYLYNQASCDGGSGDRVGCFQSRVASAAASASANRRHSLLFDFQNPGRLRVTSSASAC